MQGIMKEKWNGRHKSHSAWMLNDIMISVSSGSILDCSVREMPELNPTVRCCVYYHSRYAIAARPYCSAFHLPQDDKMHISFWAK